MSDQFTLKLSSPITDEQWDAITDVDFDQTEEIFFHTKHGKEVTFVKQKKGKWIGEPKDGIEAMFFNPKCSVCGFESAEVKNFCPNCGADMRGETDAE